MRHFVFALVALTACGDDPPPAKKPRGGEPPPKSAGGAPTPAAAKPGGRGAKDGPQPLVIKAKVPDEYRRDFKVEDFSADATGEVNRDPFYSYLVAPPAAGTANNPNAPQQTVKDDCEGRTVAMKAAFRDLKLVGIILRGTRNFAMFTDPQRVGWTVFMNECISKDKARVVEITQGCVKLEIRGEALPGAAAPPPREELSCLHPDDIAVQ